MRDALSHFVLEQSAETRSADIQMAANRLQVDLLVIVGVQILHSLVHEVAVPTPLLCLYADDEAIESHDQPGSESFHRGDAVDFIKEGAALHKYVVGIGASLQCSARHQYGEFENACAYEVQLVTRGEQDIGEQLMQRLRRVASVALRYE
ncbi:MAG: hypothetical protein QM739_16400 [Propionivibrio sp.]